MPRLKRNVIALISDDDEPELLSSQESTREGFKTSPGSGEENNTNDAKRRKLDQLLMAQEKSLTPLRTRRVDCYRTRKSSKSRAPAQNLVVSLADLWKQSINDSLREDPNFFSSDEAWMRVNKKAKKGQPAYRGMRVNLENCTDLKSIHSVRYYRCTPSGRGTSSFSNMKSVFGQIARFMITCGQLNTFEGWMDGKILSICENLKVLKVFLNYFSLNASPNTVASKANLIIAMCKFAKLHCSEKQTEKNIDLVIAHMNVRATESKTQARHDTNSRLIAEARIRNHTLVTEPEMTKGIRTAMARLKDLRATFLRNIEEGVLQVTLLKNPALLNKWCINFCGLLVLVGGGQRPQAYSQLQSPTMEELEEMAHSQATESMIVLRTLGEKTVRSSAIPGVSFPVNILPFLRMHVQQIRGIILSKCGVTESDNDRPLLLHTVHGDYLSVANVTNTVKKFMRNIDPELTNVTTMSLRACYATSCLHKYREGKTGHGLSEEQYMERLAQRMNTSVEQLRKVYTAVYEKDLMNAMKTAIDHLSVIMNEC